MTDQESDAIRERWMKDPSTVTKAELESVFAHMDRVARSADEAIEEGLRSINALGAKVRTLTSSVDRIRNDHRDAVDLVISMTKERNEARKEVDRLRTELSSERDRNDAMVREMREAAEYMRRLHIANAELDARLRAETENRDQTVKP